MNIHYRVVYRFRASVAELCHWQLMWQHAPCCHCLTLLSCLPACLPSLHSIRFPIHGQPRLISQLKWHHINPILLHSPLPVTYLPFFSSLIGPIYYILFIYLYFISVLFIFITHSLSRNVFSIFIVSLLACRLQLNNRPNSTISL